MYMLFMDLGHWLCFSPICIVSPILWFYWDYRLHQHNLDHTSIYCPILPELGFDYLIPTCTYTCANAHDLMLRVCGMFMLFLLAILICVCLLKLVASCSIYMACSYFICSIPIIHALRVLFPLFIWLMICSDDLFCPMLSTPRVVIYIDAVRCSWPCAYHFDHFLWPKSSTCLVPDCSLWLKCHFPNSRRSLILYIYCQHMVELYLQTACVHICSYIYVYNGSFRYDSGSYIYICKHALCPFFMHLRPLLYKYTSLKSLFIHYICISFHV